MYLSFIHQITEKLSPDEQRTNHLGNVLVVYSDRKIYHTDNGLTITSTNADVKSASDYYPFGMMMTDRKFIGDGSTRGFNGMEKDNEVYGTGNAYDFGAREYDARLGRWFSVDPLASKYPNMSPYVSLGDNPILYIDPDGRDVYVAINAITKEYNGHAAIIIPTYKAIQIKTENGIETRFKIDKYYIYGLMPNMNSDDFDFPQEVSIEELSENYDAILRVGDNVDKEYYTKDEIRKDRNALTAAKSLQKEKYRVLSNNCADFVKDVLSESYYKDEDLSKTGEETVNLPSGVPLLKLSEEMTTPNQLLKDMSGMEGATEIKLNDNVNTKMQEYIDNQGATKLVGKWLENL